MRNERSKKKKKNPHHKTRTHIYGQVRYRQAEDQEGKRSQTRQAEPVGPSDVLDVAFTVYEVFNAVAKSVIDDT